MIKKEILNNRINFLNELRSGKYNKGCIKSDNKGYPIIESEEDNNGCCVCGLMVMIFSPKDITGELNFARKSLGIKTEDCRYIQQELNDTDLTFDEIADILEYAEFISGESRFGVTKMQKGKDFLLSLKSIYKNTNLNNREDISWYVRHMNENQIKLLQELLSKP